jgi:hypothetical protein
LPDGLRFPRGLNSELPTHDFDKAFAIGNEKPQILMLDHAGLPIGWAKEAIVDSSI